VSATPLDCPSRTQVNKAGDVLRAAQVGEDVDFLARRDAYRTLLAFRAAHQYPLIKATMGPRSPETDSDHP